MKKLFLFVLVPFLTFAQLDMVGELRIELINQSAPWDFSFWLTSIGARWDENYDLTENYENISVRIINLDYQADFDHILHPSQYNPEFGVGLYKISVIENNTDDLMGCFYMDWRTSDWSGGLDVAFKYDVANSRFRDYDNTETIDYTYQTLWDLTDNEYETSGLENYWNHCLAITLDGNSHPRIAWGPHPSFSTTHFYLYRAIATLPLDPKEPLNFSPYIFSSSTYQFTDNQFVVGGSETYIVFYYLKAYNSSTTTFSSASNTVNTEGVWYPEKIAEELPEKVGLTDFSLLQNHPNPFNPSTTIEYILPEKNYVSLKVYDILGREVATLVDEVKETGNHFIEFNASELTSGIYLYRIQSGTYSETRKLILQK